MINWIIGGLVIGFTVYIIAVRAMRLKNGDNSCSGCCNDSKKKDCCCEKK